MSVFYQTAARAGLLGGPEQPSVCAGDIVEYYEFLEYKFIEGVFPKYAGEVLELLCDEKETLVGFKLRVLAEHGIGAWYRCEPVDKVVKFNTRVPSQWKVHASIEAFLEQAQIAPEFKKI